MLTEEVKLLSYHRKLEPDTYAQSDPSTHDKPLSGMTKIVRIALPYDHEGMGARLFRWGVGEKMAEFKLRSPCLKGLRIGVTCTPESRKAKDSLLPITGYAFTSLYCLAE